MGDSGFPAACAYIPEQAILYPVPAMAAARFVITGKIGTVIAAPFFAFILFPLLQRQPGQDGGTTFADVHPATLHSMISIPASWAPIIGDEESKPYFSALRDFLEKERREHRVFPPENEVGTALQTTPYEETRVLILGQDPYHNENQAHGLAFSVRKGIQAPPSLMNIFKELHDDLGCRIPNNGYLVPWATQGVLLLNAVLTVRAHQPNSHKNKGWETFTDAIIQRVNQKEERVVFVLWGGYARKKLSLIDTERHVVVESAHPSPLSARNGFFGSRPFSRINQALRAAGRGEIDWQIPNI